MYIKKNIAIIGGGPAAMTLAAWIDPLNYHVSIYEQQKTLGRKFLVAGKGGFNLTHAENIEKFIKRYSPIDFLAKALSEFNNEDLRQWFYGLGVPTYIGSSQRVFPEKGIKPIEVLNALVEKLHEKDVAIHTQYTWNGWTPDGDLIFNNDKIVRADFVIYALGGGSWQITGSDGKWLSLFEQQSIKIAPLFPSNCAYQVLWEKEFINEHEGSPLKNIAIQFGNISQKGELIITKYGLEGNAIYALSPEIRTQLINNDHVTVFLDIKPTLTIDQIVDKLESITHKNNTYKLKTVLKLTPALLKLLKLSLSKDEYLNPKELANYIKNFPIVLTSPSPIDEAISTVGGILLNEVNANYELKKMPHHYCIGEMLDWDAPTGGYLLQACFSMAVKVARHLNSRPI